MKRTPTFLAILAIAALPAHAAPVKTTLKFDEKSKDALVILEVEPPRVVEDWALNLSTYDVETKEFTSNSFTGQTEVKAVKGRKGEQRFLAGLVKGGGTHIAHQLNLQVFWGACFNHGTKVFTFEPGKIYYLGSIAANQALARIATELPHSTPNAVWVYDNRLALTAPAQKGDWEKDVAGFLAETLPGVKAPLVAAEGVDITFETGKAVLGGRICRSNL